MCCFSHALMAVGDPNLPKPWSKHSKKQEEEREDKKKKKKEPSRKRVNEEERDAKFEEFLRLAMPKGGEKKRKVMPWENVEEGEEGEGKEKEEGEEMDDMEWLKSKGMKVEDGKEEEEQPGTGLVDEEREGDEASRRERQTAEKISESRRIFIRNLPRTTEEEQLRKYCAKFGAVEKVVMPLSTKTNTAKGEREEREKEVVTFAGYAMVTYEEAAQALMAYTGLDGQVYQGRLLHVVAGEAEAKESKERSDTGSFRKRRDMDQSKVQRNAMFVASDAAAEMMGEKLG